MKQKRTRHIKENAHARARPAGPDTQVIRNQKSYGKIATEQVSNVLQSCGGFDSENGRRLFGRALELTAWRVVYGTSGAANVGRNLLRKYQRLSHSWSHWVCLVPSNHYCKRLVLWIQRLTCSVWVGNFDIFQNASYPLRLGPRVRGCRGREIQISATIGVSSSHLQRPSDRPKKPIVR